MRLCSGTSGGTKRQKPGSRENSLEEGAAAQRLADKAPCARVPSVEEVALLRDVVELEQPVDPDRPHHVGNARDVDEKAFEAALEERPAPHDLRVSIKEGSCGVGELGPQDSGRP